jgi:DNA-binding NarL/FixJ family response regulator
MTSGLHGRDAELAEIDRLVTAAASGRSGSLVVRGEAGVGKTALLHQAVGAAQGMRVLRGTGIESEAELPFAALHLLLRPVLDRLDALPAPQAATMRGAFGLAEAPGTDRFLVGLATLTLLAELAENRPLLCVVDDAHWLDQSSASALLFAARRLDSEGIALIFSVRDCGRRFDTTGVPELRLGGLDTKAATGVLGEHAGDLAPQVRDQIIEECQGNPLGLIELSAALTPGQRAGQLSPGAFHVGPVPVPGRIQEVFQRQIGELPEPTRLLLLAAAANDSDELALVLRVGGTLGTSVDHLEPAERAGLILLGDGRARFRHPLIRSATYHGASLTHRIAVHQAFAAALDTDEHADRRAWHLAASATGPDENIAAELERAAEHAKRRGGYAAEAAAYERAGQLSPDRPDRARRLVLAAHAAMASGQLSRAGMMADHAVGLIDDPLPLAGLADIRAAVEFEQGSSRRSARILLDGATPVATLAPDLAARMLVDAGFTAMFGGDGDAGRRAARELAALDLPPAFAAFVPAVAGMADVTAGDLAGGIPQLRSTVRSVADAVRPDPLPPGMRLIAVAAAVLAGDDLAAHGLSAALVEDCRTRGLISVLPHALLLHAQAQLFIGDLADARAGGLEALQIARDTAQVHRAEHVSGVLARICAIQGDEATCRSLTGEPTTRDSAPATAWKACSLALLDLGLGRPEAALARLTDIASGSARHAIIATYSLPDLVEAAVDAGRPDLGAAPLARFQEFADHAGRPWAVAVALRCQALLGHDVHANLTEAVRLHAAGGRPFERARTELLYGRLLRRDRRRSDARAHLRSALEIFERLGAVPWAARASGELRATGISPVARPSATGLLDRLTPQEIQVVRLAATGLTNREIGARLFLSPRTVSHHLYKAYPKLDVTTRSQLSVIVNA